MRKLARNPTLDFPDMRESRSRGRLQRRAFLSALGLGIAVPLALRMSRLAVAAPGARPTRLFIYYLPHTRR